MELLVVIGFIFGLLSIILAQFIEGSSLLALINLPALIIVLGGSSAALFIQTPKLVLKQACKISSWILYPPLLEPQKTIEQLLFWSKKSRQQGFLSIESSIYRLKDPFLVRGAELVISGLEIKDIIAIMEYEIDTIESRDLNAAKVFESFGGYTPTLGILGAVLGLIHVMQNLSDPANLGSGIAVAFVATVYGVGLANLVFIPISNRLKSYVFKRTRYYEMYLVGLASFAEGDPSHTIRSKMKSFIC